MFALLDRSKARVRMLVAPAGYGKTTLAEQWVARDGRVGVWYTARSASTDVAALALGVARAATAIVDDCDHRLREHLRALPAPAENVQTLAEILSEDLAAWPANAWLVLDDYHEVTPEPKAEDFVEALVALSPVQVLIASRVRPRWIASKSVLYGDTLELNKTALAMDNAEAATVLVGRSPNSATGLVALAGGWPAVIGLASVSAAEIQSEDGPVADSLYTYFADEIFAGLGREVQEGLTTLAVAPLLDWELGRILLGPGALEATCAAALDVGLLVERGLRLELHPLARAFLEERTMQLGLAPAAGSTASCLDFYRGRREWDAAFELIVRADLGHRFVGLMEIAFDELLETARLSTLRKWCDHAREIRLDAPVFALARAEVALRNGNHIEAIAHAEAAARDQTLKFRALSSAGRAAHLASEEEDALMLYERAERSASTDLERQDARWGQLMCAIELESERAKAWLDELNNGVRADKPRDIVRSAAYGLSYQVKLGDIDLTDADRAFALLDLVEDPMLVSAFEITYSAVLGLVTRYDEAQEVVRRFMETITRYRLDFARTYALCAESIACSGLRQWARAESSARQALEIAQASRDGHAQQLCMSQLSRVLTQSGRQREALDLEFPVLRAPLPSAQAEAVGSRSLALASVGQTQRARELIHSVEGLSSAVEPAVLISATRAICALKEHNSHAVDYVLALEATAFRRGTVDLLVTAYRSVPELLSVLMHASKHKDRLVSVIKRARDQDVAEVVGYPIADGADPRLNLSPREREVYELLVGGLTNREIAKLLYIEESTVKVHAHHIYDKLGIRSRTALTVHAMLERSDQATSATDGTSSGTDSD